MMNTKDFIVILPINLNKPFTEPLYLEKPNDLWLKKLVYVSKCCPHRSV